MLSDFDALLFLPTEASIPETTTELRILKRILEKYISCLPTFALNKHCSNRGREHRTYSQRTYPLSILNSVVVSEMLEESADL